MANKYKIKFLNKCKEQGLCMNCGKPLDNDKWQLCTVCRDKKNKLNTERRNWLKSIGYCPSCGKEKLLGDEKYCVMCRCNFANAQAKKRENDGGKYNAYMRDYMRKHTEERKELGLCTRCGKELNNSGYLTCDSCRAKSRLLKERKKLQNEVTPNKCRFCDNPVEDGYKVCEIHHSKLIEMANLPQTKIARKNMKRYGDFNKLYFK